MICGSVLVSQTRVLTCYIWGYKAMYVQPSWLYRMIATGIQLQVTDLEAATLLSTLANLSWNAQSDLVGGWYTYTLNGQQVRHMVMPRAVAVTLAIVTCESASSQSVSIHSSSNHSYAWQPRKQNDFRCGTICVYIWYLMLLVNSKPP